jgi:hypothetical protein
MACPASAEETMNYYDVGFYYPGQLQNIPLDTETQADRDLIAAEKFVEEKLFKSDLTYAHAYSWPDGSLYKYIASELDQGELRNKLRSIFGDGQDPPHISVENIYKSEPTEDPHKFNQATGINYNTLQEYMEAARILLTAKRAERTGGDKG